MKLDSFEELTSVVLAIVENPEFSHYGLFTTNEDISVRTFSGSRGVVEFDEDDVGQTLELSEKPNSKFVYLLGTDGEPEDSDHALVCKSCRERIASIKGYNPKMKIFENATIVAKLERGWRHDDN